jgi:hypothetical protein
MQRAVTANPRSSDAYADDRRLGCDTNEYAEMLLTAKFQARPNPMRARVDEYPTGARAGIFMHGSQVERVKSIFYLSFRE